MTKLEHDEYVIDIEFGEWLRVRRKQKKITTLEVANLTGIPEMRLQAIESGLTSRGITSDEVFLLSRLYQLDEKLIRVRAVGSRARIK